MPRAYAAVDSGQIINPDGLANQIEGGIVQSTSWTLKEQVRFDRDGIKSRDWLGYPILTMPEAPTVEVVLIDRPDEKPLGSGRRRARPGGGRDRQRLRRRDRQAAARPAVVRRSG